MMKDFSEPANKTLTDSTDPQTPNGELATKAPTPNRGRFQVGNTKGLKHGGRSAKVWAGEMAEQAEAKAMLGERVAAILIDLGGADAQSTVAAGLADRHCKLELVEGFLWANLQRLGPLTAKGKTRACLRSWFSALDRLHRSSITLGLERRPKRTPSLQDYLSARLAAEQAGPQHDDHKADDVDVIDDAATSLESIQHVDGRDVVDDDTRHEEPHGDR
jgi:hypothetical protein